MKESCIEIYTDGSSKGNPGRGGYGVILRLGNHSKELSQGYRKTTNIRMELMAVVVSLEHIQEKAKANNKVPNYPIVVYSDSKYVVDSIEKKWLYNWQKNQFKERKNADLWKRYLKASKDITIKFQWIRGHSGHTENERCDFLATSAADSKNLLIDNEYEESVKATFIK